MIGSIRITAGLALSLSALAAAWFTATPDYAAAIPAIAGLALLYSGAAAYHDHKQAMRAYSMRVIRGPYVYIP